MVEERSLRLPVEGAAELACRWRPGRADRPTILYLHGFGSSQAGEKAEFFRRRAGDDGLGFLSLDFRGHGDSGGGMRGLTLTRCLADVGAARAHLAAAGAAPLVVVGSSMGGLVGLWLAALEPSGILAGLHVAPAIGLAEDHASLVGPEGLRRWRQTGVIEVVNELGTFEIGWGFLGDLERYPTARLADLHRVPSLLFQGRLDDRVSWRRVADFAAAARGPVRLHLFEQGDHRLLDERREIWRRMRSFVAATERSPAAGDGASVQP